MERFIIKYDPTLSSDPYQSQEYAIMEEESHGEYGKYGDYQLLEAKIAELEKERDAAVNRVEMCNLSDWKIYQETDFGKKMLAIRDLEQQAKGVYNLRSTTGFWDLSTCLSRTHLREYEVILKNKAKALKEQGE